MSDKSINEYVIKSNFLDNVLITILFLFVFFLMPYNFFFILKNDIAFVFGIIILPIFYYKFINALIKEQIFILNDIGLTIVVRKRYKKEDVYDRKLYSWSQIKYMYFTKVYTKHGSSNLVIEGIKKTHRINLSYAPMFFNRKNFKRHVIKYSKRKDIFHNSKFV